jgi:hypothetical protein
MPTDPTTPPAGNPTSTPPAQPSTRRVNVTTFEYLPNATPDPTDPANYYSAVQGQLPQSDDIIYLRGSTMTLHGHTLDGTQIILGKHGGEIPLPDPVLNMTGDASPRLVGVWSPKDDGSHAVVNVSGENTVNAMIGGTGDPLHPTKATLDINVADNSMMIGQITAVDAALNIHAQGPNATLQLTSQYDSDLVRANKGADGFVHIEPNMIGTGKMQMHFSNCEISGSVAPQVEIDLYESNVLTLDHANTFKGIINFEQQGSTVFLKDFHPNADGAHANGGTFWATDVAGNQVNFTMKFDTSKFAWSDSHTAAGLDIFLVAK